MSEPRRPIRRRTLIAGAGTLGLAAGAGGGALVGRASAGGQQSPEPSARLTRSDARVTDRSLPMGLGRPAPAFGSLVAFELTPSARRTPARARAAAVALLRRLAVLADDAAGTAAGDTGSDGTGAAALDLRPASLEITPALGAALLDACDLPRPEALVDLPQFATDRLDPSRTGGDLVVQIGAEDPLKVSGTVSSILAFVRAALGDQLRVRWSRSGFRNTAAGSLDPATTGRNVMGHRDGTANQEIGTPLWQVTVQAQDPAWMVGGSYLVVREIRIDLDAWYDQDEHARDRVVGRRTVDGAPLGRRREAQQVDLVARHADGGLVVPADAHVRLAGPQHTLGARIHRRSWNFDDGYIDGTRHAGLLFLAWQADIRQGFLPIQRALVEGHDALNRFTTHVGSAVVAAPARGDDDYVGQRLFEA